MHDQNQPDTGNHATDPLRNATASIPEHWGRAVLDRTEWRGDETVLDAGCGAGRMFSELIARIPAGRLYAVDHSSARLRQARIRLEQLAPAIPVQLLEGSLTELRLCENGGDGQPCLPELVDVVYSHGVFHWIPDKLKLFAALMRVMRPNGRLLSRYSGEKHLQRIRAAAYRAGRGLGLETEVGAWLGHFHLVPVADAKELLKVCGFRQVKVWEESEDIHFPDRAAFLQFCGTTILESLLSSLPEARRAAFLDAFAQSSVELLGGWRLDAIWQNADALR